MAEFDKKFSNFPFFKNEDLCNWSEGIEFLKNQVIGQLKNDGLVDADQKDSWGTLSIGLFIAHRAVGSTIAHLSKINNWKPNIIALIKNSFTID